MEKQLSQLEAGLKKLENKESKIYFLTQDTEGRAAASVSMNYQFVKHLVDAGYNAYVLYEKTEYQNVSEWLGEEYSSLPHSNIEGGDLKVGPQDFVVVPELYGHVLEQINKMPCTKIIFCQAYDYILETLNPGFGWTNYGVTKCITTTDSQKEYIKNIFPSIETTVIRPSFADYFIPSPKPKKPVIAIHTRDPRDTMKIIKAFYLKNPQFKWVSFKDMRNMKREEFAEALGESCLSVWLDRTGGFGTFPLESMLCNTPVVGTLPILKPDWLTNENGLWVNDESKVVEMVGNYMKNWLEDSVPENLYSKMKDSVKDYTLDNERNGIINFFNSLLDERKTEFNNSINKLTPVGVNS
tara:strand:- start:5017 stop:6078 length:1062 start_codon:yes stop_codon:yes gene_type:complete